MQRKISIGMVGVGQFGSEFIQSFKDHPHVERLALCDLDASRLAKQAKRFGISETYPSLDAICKSDLDALVIITQPWLHAPQAIQALEAGKHVYSAVPVMMSHSGDVILDWCDKLVEAVKRTGQLYMMGETSFFRPEVVYCRRKVQEGAFGDIVLIESEYLHDIYWPACDLIKVAMGRTGKSREQIIEIGGDVPLHYPTHSTSVPISITGAHMTEVSALGYVYPHDDYFRHNSESGNPFSNEIAQFRMSNGAVARVFEGRRIGYVGREGLVRLIGTEASLDCELAAKDDKFISKFVTKTGWERVDAEAARDTLPEPLASNLGEHGGSHAYLVHEFVEACATERLPKINAWEAVRYVAAGVMAHKSALKGGELLKVPDWGSP